MQSLRLAAIFCLLSAVFCPLQAQMPGGSGGRVPPQMGGTGSTTGSSFAYTTPGGQAIPINCNQTGDTLMILPGAIAYGRLNGVYVVGESGSFSTAKIGVYTGPGQTGQTIVAQSALSAITTVAANTPGRVAGLSQAATPALVTGGTPLYINVGTPQGGACEVNFYMLITPFPNG